MNTTDLFTTEYLTGIQDGTERCASEVVGRLMQLAAIGSVIDIGCGNGAWLAEFMRSGVTDVLGVDGPYVNASILQIPAEKYVGMDLRGRKPINRTADLVLCLEVAHYLAADDHPAFADYLMALSPCILFSCAIPGQPGKNHVSPQWHDYWHRLFEKRGYAAFDFIRPDLWHNENIPLHFRQNIFLYVRNDHLQSPAMKNIAPLARANCLTLVDMDSIRTAMALRATLNRLPGLLIQKLTGKHK